MKTHEWPIGSGRRHAVVDAGKVYETDRLVDLGEVAQRSGMRCDVRRCVAALALREELGAQDVMVMKSRIWVLETITEGPYRGQTLYVRWVNGSPRAIEEYDNGGPPPRAVVLRRPSGTETQEGKQAQNRTHRPNWPSTKTQDPNRKIRRGKPRYGDRSQAGKIHTKEESAE